MPLLKIQSNVSVEPDKRPQLLSQVSETVAEALGKPERYVMVALESSADMLFAGEDQPLAYVELKSIDLPEQQTGALSERICGLLETSMGIHRDRVYIEFVNSSRHLWGWNGGTF